MGVRAGCGDEEVRTGEVTERESPIERGTDVVPLPLEAGVSLSLATTRPLCREHLCHPNEVVEVTIACQRDLAAILEALTAVLAQRLQQAIASPVSSRRAVTIDLSTSEARRSTTSRRSDSVSAQTASAARMSKPPANTDSRSKSLRSSSLRSWYDQSTVARSVRWCPAASRSGCSSAAGSGRRGARGCRADVSERTRAAASSIASGRPSRRLQMASIVERSTSSGSKDASAAAALRQNKRRGV